MSQARSRILVVEDDRVIGEIEQQRVGDEESLQALVHDRRLHNLHALLGAQFTATSMIGMIALAGIIVRNSILLVDFINEEVARGVAFEDAVVRAGAIRAKPIVLTGLAAILGALFILDDPIFRGLAIALIFGLLISTLLTLVVIPVLYYALMRRRFS